MRLRFSIVVPVYNVEQYLRECLDSIKSQTYGDFECLMVDDGSTDKSKSILQEFLLEDSRFKLISQTNQGVSAARNTGIRYAKGQYICFVDADDIIATTYLEDLYIAMGSNSESSMCGFLTFDQKKGTTYTVLPASDSIESLEENLYEFYDTTKPKWHHYLWNRMFSLDLIKNNGLQFRKDIYYKEDGLFVVQYLCHSNGLVGCTKNVDYFYRADSGGAISRIIRGFDKKMVSNLIAHKIIIKELTNRNVGPQIIAKAKGQAKAVANWIDLSIMRYDGKSFYLIFRVEFIILQILGIRDYFRWRGYSLLSKLR